MMKARGIERLILAGAGLALVAATPASAQQQPPPQQEPPGQEQPLATQVTEGQGLEEQAQVLQLEQLLEEAERAIQQDDFRTAHDLLDQASGTAQEAMLQDRGGFPREQLQELELAISETQQAVRGEDARAAQQPLQAARQSIEEARAALPEPSGAAEQEPMQQQ